ncbi:MAG TPA: hypothetical protein VMZ71_10185 [Gemmataceae bacterium]|nr:hypothetical protein [Gemmataceae bacterium]
MTALLLLALVAADPPKPPLDKNGQPDFEAGLNDVLSKGVTPEKNANALLWQAFGPSPEGGDPMPAEFYRRLGIKEPPKNGNYFVDQTKFARDGLKLPQDQINTFHENQGKASRTPWTANEYPQLAAWLTANDKPLLLVTEAVKRSHYYNPLVSRREGNKAGSLIGVLLPSVQKCRELVAALSARAMLRVGEKKYDAAWEDLMTCHRLGRHLSHGGTLIEGLVGIAIEAIAANSTLAFLEKADLNSAQLRDKLKDLQNLPKPSPMADKIDTGERYMYADCAQMLKTGGPAALGGIAGEAGGNAPKLTPEQQKAWANMDWSPIVVDGNKWYDRMSAAMRLPTRAERHAAMDKIDAELKELTKNAKTLEQLAMFGKGPPDKAVVKAISDILIGMLLPAVRKVQEAEDRNTQTQQNLQVAFALAIFKQDTGRYPAELGELAPKYLPAVPGDVFTGKPLVYRVEGTGYVFYSFGMNGKDDNGQWYDDEPRGDDIRVRMPIRQPKP